MEMPYATIVFSFCTGNSVQLDFSGTPISNQETALQDVSINPIVPVLLYFALLWKLIVWDSVSIIPYASINTLLFHLSRIHPFYLTSLPKSKV